MKKTGLAASYMLQFECLGSACEETCCSGWSVSIDKKTFAKYKQLPDKKQRRLLTQHIHRNKYETTFSDYATIRMNEDGFCPFLSKEKLCSIQLQMGPGYLSRTCASYPRTQGLLYDQYQLAGSPSCPEVARLALLNPEGISFTELETVPADPALDKLFEDDHYRLSADSIREFIISLLQYRACDLDSRLVLLGMFLSDLDELAEQEDYSAIPQLIASHQQRLLSGEMPVLQANPGNEWAFTLLHSLIDQYVAAHVKNKRYLEKFAQIKSAIGNQPERYLQAYHANFVPFCNDHGYILENYLVNYVFAELFPFFHNRSFLDEFCVLVLHYSLVKFHLVGLAGHQQTLTPDEAAAMIQSFARTFEHDITYFSQALNFLQNQQANTLAHMAMLLGKEAADEA
ncbi:flagellin lysine-N-methylase [Brevibacillus fulvus]|uniref:Lysine-N-methylase n=1 Tax=Brevibacillus fulvus TaxID=1125967 RepID=A0A939BSG9_9BACL|nr:flagellin lysine-N-methylase [Brevibacillus fulvus]MBM7590702.1 lysine-N-methylase [Brevibacillus fulvus]